MEPIYQVYHGGEFVDLSQIVAIGKLTLFPVGLENRGRITVVFRLTSGAVEIETTEQTGKDAVTRLYDGFVKAWKDYKALAK